jgi:hypothetical protein
MGKTWGEIKAELYAANLTEQQVLVVCKMIADVCNKSTSDAHWREYDFGD